MRARLRAQDGTNFCSKLRRGGRTPGLLFSLPGETSLKIDMDTKEAAAHVSDSRCRDANGHACARHAPGPNFTHNSPTHKYTLHTITQSHGQVRNFGRNGILARVMRLELEDEGGSALGSVRVLVSAWAGHC